MRLSNPPRRLVALVFLLLPFSPAASSRPAAAQTPPAEAVGRAIGEDRFLMDWSTISGYIHQLDEESDRLEVQTLGTSTLGRPFLLAVVSDREGLTQQARVRETIRQLYQVDALDDAKARELAAAGKAVVALSLGLHSTEVGASQASVEMLYELVTREDDLARQIRENLVVLVVPSMNPDGLDIVVDWYEQTLGTPAEGSYPPWLYHHYAGHDNNRDAFFNNLKETALWSKVLYHDWLPQVILDEHQMGPNGPRLFLPPFDDPLSPTVHPLVYAQLSAAGQQTVSELTAKGWTGIATSTIFTAEWPGSVRSTGFWHNMLGILSEVASVRLATPLYYPPGSLRGAGRGLTEYERRANFLQPWEGGWWRLRDIVELDLDLTWSFLAWAARHKTDLLYNFYQMNRDAVVSGRREAPYGFVIGVDQHDRGAAYVLAEKLRQGGVELGYRSGPFTVEGRWYESGAFVALSAQPFRPFLLEMLDSPPYPVIDEGGNGEVVRPYDVTAWRLPDLLHVQVQKLEKPWSAGLLDPVDGVPWPVSQLEGGGDVVRLSGRDNASTAAALALLREGQRVERVLASASDAEAGDFVVRGDATAAVRLARQLRARPDLLADLQAPVAELRTPRVGLYVPHGGSMDEGWTRWVLDQHGFDHESLRDEDVTKLAGGEGRRLRRRFDAIVIASIGRERMLNGAQPKGHDNIHTPVWSEEYRGGLGGVDSGLRLREFVAAGGTLIALDRSTPWVIEFLGLPAQVELEDLSRDDFYAPGTLLRAQVDADHALGWGMPPYVAVYFAQGRSFRPLAWPRPTAVVVRYADSDVQVSGFLVGGDRLEGRPALLDVPHGEGHVVLFGFSPQRRGQTQATFKLLFNALMRSAMARPGSD